MAGTLSIVVNGTINGFGVPYNGDGSLFAAVKGQRQTAVTYSGAGALSGSTAFKYSRSAALSGSGTLVGDLDQNYFMQFQEEASGTLSATTTSRYYQVKTMGLSSGGALTATALQSKVLFDEDVIVGSATTTYGAPGRTHTWNHVNAGNYIFVSVLQSGGFNGPNVQVTCNGNAMSLLSYVANGSNARLYVYGTNNVIIGTNAMQAVTSWSSGSYYSVARSTSFSNLGSLGTIKTGASTSSSASITNITTTANGALFTVLGFKNSGDTTDYGWNLGSIGGNTNGVYFEATERSGVTSTPAATNTSIFASIGDYNVITGQFEAGQTNPWAMITVPINR